MQETDSIIFIKLFKAAHEKCFNQPMQMAMGETESKLFANKILDRTGLTVGWRSLKNYSIFISGSNNLRNENPSIATLDTLSRYVLEAPYTNEINRKEEEGHHPYWFLFREQQLKGVKKEDGPIILLKTKLIKNRWSVAVITLFILTVGYFWYLTDAPVNFNDNFKTTSELQLASKGWSVYNKDAKYWSKRNQLPGLLTLFTLEGDSWPDSSTSDPKIKDLMLRSTSFNCFSTEVHMVNFVPSAEWQQAGLLLLQDSTLTGPSVRLSLAYNDNFGGYHRPDEIVAQAIYSSGIGLKPEEFAHFPVLTLDSAKKIPSLLSNLKNSALKIEKNGQHFRFLYSAGNKSNAAFKEIAEKDLPFKPRYIGIFAFKGNGTKSAIVPVQISMFTLQKLKCD